MVWNETCNGYCHENEEVQDRINKSKARNAPAYDSGYLLLYFQSMVAGEEESIRLWHQGLMVNENIDWKVVEQLNTVHNQLQAKGKRNMQ